MKRRLFALLFLVLLSTSISNAQAEIPSDVAQRKEEKREEIQERREERAELREEKRLEIQERLTLKKATRAAQLAEKRKARISSYFNRMVRRIDATITRLQILIERIENRLAIIQGTNDAVDVALISAQIDEAKNLLDQASSDLAAANDELSTVLESEDPKAAFGIIRETISEVRNNLKEVHSILVHVIGDIRGLRVGNTGGGESPNPTNTEPTPTIDLTPTLEPTPTDTQPTPTEIEPTPTAEVTPTVSE